MKHTSEERVMERSTLAVSLTAALYFGLVGPAMAAQAAKPAVAQESTAAAGVGSSSEKPAKQCMADLRTFDGKMQKDGYWLHGSGRGYGYPVYGYAGGREMLPPGSTGDTSGTKGAAHVSAASGTMGAADYWRERPGYELRTLIVAANILARRGQQSACEGLLTATRAIYKTYSTELRNGKVPRADVKDWRHQQIAAAQPVTGNHLSFRSDQLIGTDVVNSKNEDLGSVDDIVLSPRTGKIAYLVIGRGGVFGIDEKYVPVPWKDFKTTSDSNLLVLDIAKDKMDAAPTVSENEFAPNGDFATQSKKVQTYWTAKS